VLRAARCGQSTGMVDDKGEQLFKDVCRKSCDMCGTGVTAAEREKEEYGEELEEFQEKQGEEEAAETPEMPQIPKAPETETPEMPTTQELEELEEKQGLEEAAETPQIPQIPKGPETETPEMSTTPVKRIWSAKAPQPSDVCKDDSAFINSNLQTCHTFIANIGQPVLRAARCGQSTGMVDDKGEQLSLKYFCKKSCDMCGNDVTAADREKEEFVEELEELEEKEELGEEGNQDDGVIGSDGDNEGEVSQEDLDLWEELKEEENASEEEEAESGVGSNIVDNETSGEEGHEGGDFSSEGKLDVSPVSEEDSLPSRSPDGSFEGPGEQLPDYFVPLTPIERDVLKEKLRGILSATKNSLILNSSKLESHQSQKTLVLSQKSPKLFMHLQQQQTGSDSIDGLISCALDRQKELHDGAAIGYSFISEDRNLEFCMNDLANRLGASLIDGEFYKNDQQGNALMNAKFDPSSLDIPFEARNACDTSEASVMGYCTSLDVVRTFGWQDVDSIAIFENPVERTHRVYQLTAQECYGCKDFKDVLRQINDETFTSDDGSCVARMIGHQAALLLSSPHLHSKANDLSFPQEHIVEEAVRNLREGITWIGLADRIEESVAGFKEVFPWLADNLNGAALFLKQEFAKRGDRVGTDVNFALPENYIDEHGCVFEHRNEDHYTCGSRGIDEETLSLIKKLNMRDLAVYKAAVERFAIQNEVLTEYRLS